MSHIRAVIRRLQSLQCAGVEDVAHSRAVKLLEILKSQKKTVQLSTSGIQTVSPTVKISENEPRPWEKRVETPTVKPAVNPTTQPSTTSASGYSSGYGMSKSYGNSTNNRGYSLMAPKRQPLSLEIILPPHEDYTSLTQMEDRREALRLLGEKVAKCVRCIDLVSNRTQTVLGTGNPYASLMFLGEAPGKDEDLQGIPFVGRAGQLLTDMIQKGMKINREEETYICNILRCRPPGNRAPMPEEAFKCRRFLDTQIDIVKPKFICCLGASAAQYLLDTTTTISRMRLREYRYRDAVVVCTYHPAYLLRNPSQKKATWEDLQFLMKLMGIPLET